MIEREDKYEVNRCRVGEEPRDAFSGYAEDVKLGLQFEVRVIRPLAAVDALLWQQQSPTMPTLAGEELGPP